MVREINLIIDGEFEGCPEADWFRRIFTQVLDAEDTGMNVEMGLLITDQEKIQELNKTYRGKDRPTDVLAFYMTSEEEKNGGVSTPFVVPPDGLIHLGEVIISYPQAVIQAQERGHSVDKELAVLTVHGVLHLLGYDHEKPDQRQKMTAREQAISNIIPLSREAKSDEQS